MMLQVTILPMATESLQESEVIGQLILITEDVVKPVVTNG
jgi:hypothetical protein